MEYLFIGATILLGIYALLTVLFVRTRLSAGIGVGLTSMLMVGSVVYVVWSGAYSLSLLLFIGSIVLPRLLTGAIIGSSLLKNVISMYMSIIRIGISEEELEKGRQQFSDEMREMLDKKDISSYAKPGMAEDILAEAESYSKEEYNSVKKVAKEKGSITDDEIFSIIGRQYTKAAVIKERLMEDGVISDE